jgi:hypothetical protein
MTERMMMRVKAMINEGLMARKRWMTGQRGAREGGHEMSPGGPSCA